MHFVMKKITKCMNDINLIKCVKHDTVLLCIIMKLIYHRICEKCIQMNSGISSGVAILEAPGICMQSLVESTLIFISVWHNSYCVV